ncbi:hypothetical protein SELMODRAFT_431549 [Selaginella moellendorffii]|uniref:Uncharacterized protein n=1 Tax=Selaginella moellendorffii TaxID=88036 RepID=D8TD10_SELML|nr:hypothetical protein SELMODRAFT_431549 [Selaginella moellendorffii]
MKLKKKKGIHVAFETIKRELGEFQKQKQTALNQIDIAITLYIHQLTGVPQVEYIENAAIPKDLSGGLVFTNASLKQLRATIERHVAKKAALRRLQKDLRKEYASKRYLLRLSTWSSSSP